LDDGLGNVVIADGLGDTLTLDRLNKAALNGLAADCAFRS
jgi:hypothetical protein